MRKLSAFILAIVMYSSALCAGSFSASVLSGENGYLSGSASLMASLGDDFYLLLNDVYIKDTADSWAGEKLYKFGIGISSQYTNVELDYSSYRGVADYAIGTISTFFTLNLNNTLKGPDHIKETDPFWDNFATSLTVGLVYALHTKSMAGTVGAAPGFGPPGPPGPLPPPRPPAPRAKPDFSLSETAAYAGITETVFGSTIIKASYYSFAYNLDLDNITNPVAGFQHRFDEFLGGVSDFPADALVAGVTEFFFNYYAYIYAGYTGTRYVLSGPSDSYTAILGVYPAAGFEVYALYSRYFDPSNGPKDYYSIGTVLYFK